MTAFPVIEHLDIFEDVLCRFARRRVMPMVHELALQRPEEAFNAGIVPAIALRLMLAVMRYVASICWYDPAAYWADSTGRRNPVD